MSRIAVILLGLVAALLSACNMAPPPAPVPPSGVTTSPGTSPGTTPTPQISPISGDWQFSTTSTTGMSAMQVGGGLVESGGSVTGAMPVGGSTCFDRQTTISLTGTLTGNQLSLTSAAFDGQVIALTGTIAGNASGASDNFTGTYTINGGCGGGDKGTVTGVNIYVDQAMDGTFTSSQQQSFIVSGGLYQLDVNPDGSSALEGESPFTFSTPCFSSATVTGGSLSSGSYIIGTEVYVEFHTPNGTITFTGTLDLNSYDLEFDSYQIDGNYTVSGGTCDGTGTAALRVYNPWDY